MIKLLFVLLIMSPFGGYCQLSKNVEGVYSAFRFEEMTKGYVTNLPNKGYSMNIEVKSLGEEIIEIRVTTKSKKGSNADVIKATVTSQNGVIAWKENWENGRSETFGVFDGSTVTFTIRDRQSNTIRSKYYCRM